MSTPSGNRWKAMIVLSCDHGGLMPCFQRLEDELRRALDSLDDPRDVRRYLEYVRLKSREILNGYPFARAEKWGYGNKRAMSDVRASGFALGVVPESSGE